MNPSSIALLIVALLMASTGSDVDRIDVLIDGSHGTAGSDGALVLVDGSLDVDPDSTLEGPVYVVGGRLTVDGRVAGDVVQLAGTVSVGGSGAIGGELRHIAGRLDVAPGAEVADLEQVEPGRESAGLGGPVSTAVIGLLLAGMGFLAARRRPEAVDRITDAAVTHPVVTLTVGGLVTVTFLAVFVFMAFTLVLLPVAIVGLVAGVTASILGLVGLGNAVGRRLPIRRGAVATGGGVVAVVASMQLVALVPFVGDWVALLAILIGLGAVVVTYVGMAPFDVAALPGLAPAGPTADD